MEHPSSMFCVSCSAWHGLHPFGDVVDSNKDVLAVLGLLEGPHEVNAPHIKYFYLKVEVEGHCVASCDATLELALPTPPNEFFGVLVHCQPEETTLPDFVNSIMTFVRC